MVGLAYGPSDAAGCEAQARDGFRVTTGKSNGGNQGDIFN
jgi:hypothetical protein